MAPAPAPGDRRMIHNAGGRRVAGRRAPMVAALDPPELPRPARRDGAHVHFAIRIERAPRVLEDVAAARLLIRTQAGDRDAFRALYLEHFDPVYAYLRLALQSLQDVEDGLQSVFGRVLAALPDHKVDSMPFRVWLATLLYGHAPDRDEPVTRLIETPPSASSSLHALDVLEWLNDADLRMLMERLPALEREVMSLCYVLDLTAREIARVSGLSVADVEAIHSRSIRFMERCVLSLGRRPGYSGRHPIKAAPRPEIVMRRRKLALSGG
ncbi:MAG: RNA polymerase sigma factor [Thermoleophilaceae bacterium]